MSTEPVICTSTGLAKTVRHAVSGAGLEREDRAVAGGARIEQVDGAEISLVARQRDGRRRAVAPRVEIRGGVERQQHGHGLRAMPVKNCEDTALSCTSAGIARGSERGTATVAAKLKVFAAAGWA